MKAARKWLAGTVALLACSGLTMGGWALLCHGNAGRHAMQVGSGITPDSLPRLLALRTNELAGMDVAIVNLLCAEGLPHASSITLHEVQHTLDEWARRVASETERNFHQFRDNPAGFNNSEVYYRMLALVTVLQQDFGVHYNAARIHSPDYSDSRDLFLCGILGPEREGTCLSMPVLYVAVGRRLGYPLKLVTTKAHLFARWESADGRERLNLEGTNQGLNCFPDEYYRSWPVAMSEADAREGGYLKSLNAAEELAVFLSARGHCLEVNGRLAEAQLAQAQAHVLAPQSPVYLAFLAGAVGKEMPNWRQVQIDLGQNQAVGNENR